jgi:uncharacterized protein
MTETGSRVESASLLLPHRRFTAAGETYVYASETGGLFRADEAVRDALSALAASGTAAPPEVLADLERAGLLRTGTVPARPGGSALPSLRVRTLVLMLTDSCNLSCRYCYEARDEGCAPPADAVGAPREMSVEMLRKSIGFLLDSSGGSRKVSVVFFGGEPLLRFPLLRAAVPEARAMARERGKEISFSLTTNGTLITREIADFLRGNGISACISIDGPPKVHDRNRSYVSGRGSYDDVARGISFLRENRGGYPLAARVTLGRGAVDVRGTFDHLRGLGFDEVGFAPASASEGNGAALTEEELDRAMEGFRELAAGYEADVRERRMPAFSNLTQVLSLVHRGDPMPYPCGAGIGMLAVDPSGAFYPCHRLCGVGNDLGGPERGIASGARDRFLEGARMRRESACDACWAKNFCSGGCYHDAYLRQGDLFVPSTHYCRWIRELFLLGLQTYVRIQKETPTFLDVMFGERGIA